MLVGAVLLAGVETAERINYEAKVLVKNPLHEASWTKINQLLKDVDLSNYQAILPIPFYHVGVGNVDYTIHPQENWCRATYQLALASQLPLMSSKMSRTATTQADALFSLFSDAPVSKLLLEQLSEQPILVFHSKNEKDYHTPKFERPKLLAQNAMNSVKEWESLKIKTLGDWELYSVTIADLKKKR